MMILALLYVYLMLVWAACGCIVLMFLVTLFVMQWFDGFVERYAVNFNEWEAVDNSRLVSWGTITRSYNRVGRPKVVQYFRLRLPFSLVWDRYDFGRSQGWCERQIVWMTDEGWHCWHEPVR
jgi:hypothetical protein